jgi:hypothetical protein
MLGCAGMTNLKSLLFVLSLPILAALAADHTPPPSTIYNGISLKPAADLIQKNPATRQFLASNPHFGSADQLFPLASDNDTAEAMCILLGGTKLVTFTGASGQIRPTDVLAYSGTQLVTAATKLGLDPQNYATPVIDTMTCTQ